MIPRSYIFKYSPKRARFKMELLIVFIQRNQLLAFYHFINTCKYCTGLSSLGAVRTGKGEELVNVIGLEKTPLLWILEHSVCEKLLEDLSMELNKKSNILDFQ